MNYRDRAIEQDQLVEASDKLLELLLQHHPSCAPPIAIAPPEPPTPEPPEPSPPEPAPPVEAVVTPLNPVRTIIKAAARHFNFTMADLLSSRRRAPVCRARHIAMYLSHQMTTGSFPHIGRQFGGLDHTTIMHGVSKIERLLPLDERLSDDVAAVRDLALAAGVEEVS